MEAAGATTPAAGALAVAAAAPACDAAAVTVGDGPPWDGGEVGAGSTDADALGVIATATALGASVALVTPWGGAPDGPGVSERSDVVGFPHARPASDSSASATDANVV